MLLIVALLALDLIAVLAVILPGPKICLLPSDCTVPPSLSWPFKPGGLSGIRIAAVFGFFLALTVLLAVVNRGRTRWLTAVIGILLAILFSTIVVNGASPIGQWYAPDGRAVRQGVPSCCPSRRGPATVVGGRSPSLRWRGPLIGQCPART